MNRERLQHLKAILERVDQAEPDMDARPGFDMQTWHCGTSACALGHACLDPKFRAEGLHLGDGALPMFEGAKGFVAGAEFFGISYRESKHLFGPTKYSIPTRSGPNGKIMPRDVIRRIDILMDRT
jgi:hypothetical protein